MASPYDALLDAPKAGSPYDALLKPAPQAAPSPYDALLSPEPKAPVIEPGEEAAHAAANPDQSEAAFRQWQQRDDRPFSEKAKSFAGEFAKPSNYVDALKGVGKFAAGLVATPALAAGGVLANSGARALDTARGIVTSPEEEAARETAEANANGQDTSAAAKLAGLATTAKAQSVLAGQGIENQIGSHVRKAGQWLNPLFKNLASPEAKEADQRQRFNADVASAKEQQQLAAGQPLNTGVVAGLSDFAPALGRAAGLDMPSEAPAALAPTALSEMGAPQANQTLVGLEEGAANPENLLLAKAGDIPGVSKVGGAITQGLGKAAQIPGAIVDATAKLPGMLGLTGKFAKGTLGSGAIYGAYAHPAVAGAAAAVAAGAKGLQWLGKGLEEQGGAARTGGTSALDTASGIARATGKSSLLTDAQRAVGSAGVGGVSTALGMAPLNALESGGDPNDFAKSEINAGVFGAALGGTKGAFDRASVTEAVKPYLAERGKQSMELNSAEGRASAQLISNLPEDQQQNALALMGALSNLPTESGAPARMILMDGPAYQQKVASLGGQTPADGGRGFYWDKDGTAYINAGSDSFANPGEAAHTMGHEFGGHVAMSILRAASAEGGPLYKGLMDEATKGLILPSGQPTGAFRQFIDSYNRSFDPTGQHQQLDPSDPKALEEWIAEQAGQQIAQKGVGDIAIPDNIRDRIAQGVGRFASTFTGIDPRKVGGATKFSREEIGGLSGAVRDSLQQLAGMKLRGEGIDPRLANANEFGSADSPPAQTDVQRVEQLKEILAQPRPPAGSPLTDVQDWIKGQRDARSELKSLQTDQPTPFPAGGPPPVAPSAPAVPPTVAPPAAPTSSTQQSAQTRIAARQAIPTIRAMFGGSEADAQAAIDAVQAEATSPITTPEEIFRAVAQRAQRMKNGQPGEQPIAPVPPSPPSGETAATPPLPASTPEQPVVAATSPTDEIRTAPKTDEPVPARAGPLVAEPPAAEPPVEPNALSKEDFNGVAERARAEFLADKALAKAGKNKGQHTKENQRLADKAAFDAVAAAHGETVPINYQGIRQRTDAFGKKSVSGMVDPARPFDAWLLDQANTAGNLDETSQQTLQDLQSRIGKLTEYDYGHAPTAPEGEQPTGETRTAQQEEHTATARAKGEAPQQVEQKNSIPLNVQFNSGNKSFTVTGASPEKLLNNFNHLAEAISQVPGETMPYRNINDPRFVADFKGAVRNQQNGWRADGSAPRVGTAEYPSNPTEGFGNSPERYQMPPERADFINALLANESLKGAASPKPTPEALAKAHLANVNEQPMSAEGEPNPLRERLNAALAEIHGPFLDRNGKPSTWSKVTLEDPIDEAIRPDLASNIREPSQQDASIRPHGKLGDISRFFSEGIPNRAAAAANFMPEERTGKTGESGNAREDSTQKTHPAALNLVSKYPDIQNEDAGAGEVARIPVEDINFAGQSLEDVSPLNSNKGKPIIVRETPTGYDILDGYGRASGIRNAGGEYVDAILVTKGDIVDLARGRSGGDDIDWNSAVYEKYGLDPSKLKSGNFMPEDTGKPGQSDNPMENLAREAEEAGVPMSAATLMGLIRQDPDTMASVRNRIHQKTGKPARFMPPSPATDLLAPNRFRMAAQARIDDRKKRQTALAQ